MRPIEIYLLRLLSLNKLLIVVLYVSPVAVLEILHPGDCFRLICVIHSPLPERQQQPTLVVERRLP